jgi:hypothetical protein
MERLQWWLLLLSAVMFSMSGCATLSEDWKIWTGHPAHFASADHMTFSAKPHHTAASITEVDKETATREEWWGRIVPGEMVALQPLPDLDVSGHWRGRWTASGPFGERRGDEAEMIFVQWGNGGNAQLKITGTVAATGVPEVVRYHDSLGMPLNYQVTRGEVRARFEDGTSVDLRFTRVGDRLYGRVPTSPTFLLVLDRQP